MPKPRALSLETWLPAALVAAAAWLACRLVLRGLWSLPLDHPGALVLAGVLAASAWVVVEEPVPLPGAGRALAALLAALALLAAGESLLYYRVPFKEPLAGLGLGGLTLGAALLWPRPGWPRRLAALAALLMMAVGVDGWLHRQSINWDLANGPFLGQAPILLLWLALALAGAALVWSASRAPAQRLAAEPLDRAWEWGLLALILAAAAALRFYKPGGLPAGWWYDELNLSRVIQARVLDQGSAPLYVNEQVENPGAYLWVGGALFQAFGVRIQVLRLAAGAFGLLSLLPFWGLARLWLGPRWALAATLAFAALRWVAIAERIAFMSGFALFWMLAAFWALWSAQLRPRRQGAWPWAWLLAGLLLGANLHTYTPARAVPALALAFLLGQGLLDPAWRLGRAAWLALGLGFLAVGGPMLYYIAGHWGEYLHRAQEVSIFTDVVKTGHPLLPELWGSLAKHLLMFHFRGDYNGRHNLYLYPHADFLLACGLAAALPWTLGRARLDARARFVWLWLAVMMAAAVLSVPVEAPQGNRSILAAPALVLAAFLGLRQLLAPLGERLFRGGWPVSARAVGCALLLGAAALNADELLRLWPDDPATFRSFSPEASAVLRRVEASPPGTAVYVSLLQREYQFHGFEMAAFARFALRQQSRGLNALNQANFVGPSADGVPCRAVLLVWGDSDTDISAAFRAQFPDIPVEEGPQPFPGPDQPQHLYLAAEVPYDRIPPGPRKGPAPLLARSDTPL